jgi:hypothetical protein
MNLPPKKGDLDLLATVSTPSHEELLHQRLKGVILLFAFS